MTNFQSLTQEEREAYRAGERAAASPFRRKTLRDNPYARHSQANLYRRWKDGYRERVAFDDSLEQ